MIRVASAVAAAVLMNAALAAQAPVTPGLPPPQVVPSPAPAPGASPAPQPQTTVPAQAAVASPPAIPLTRTFSATTGLLFNTVRPERVADFETVLWYLQQALMKSTDPTVRAQAAGWTTYKATEPGPNGSVLYVFVLSPAVPKADYGLGRILADAYPERIREIWALYQGAVTGGGSLLNLMPVEPAEPAPIVAPAMPATPLAPRTPPPGVTPGGRD